jgi:hypothetical protein
MSDCSVARYAAVNGGFEIFGSREQFNRVLYGSHRNDHRTERFFTFAGDAPIFMGATTDYTKNLYSYYAKNGLLKSGLALTKGKHVPFCYSPETDLSSQWFHDAKDIRSRFVEGVMTYELTQCSLCFPDVRVEIEALPLLDEDGFLIHYRITTDQRVIFCAGFGAITDYLNRFEYSKIKDREYHVGDSRDNTLSCGVNRVTLQGPREVTLRLGASFDVAVSRALPEAFGEPFPGSFMTDRPGSDSGCVARLERVIAPGETLDGFLVMVRNEDESVLDQWLRRADAVTYIKDKIRGKTRHFQMDTPDAQLDLTVSPTVMALDASWHGSTFYHGAHGYHTPFLGWRNYYAPTAIGWKERVSTAIRAHLATQLRADGAEKVWYDGSDRPELDHEGTQYHHLTNISGRLPALLHRDDIYNMHEVFMSMTLHYIEHELDLQLAAECFEALSLLLDHEERIYDSDNDGLYQNFLNTWISDGHSYNGGGCAQSSAYNLQANVLMGKIARRINRDPAVFEARAAKIQQALQGRLWLEDAGVMAEYIDTVGNRLIHPSPELSTLYLAIECGAVDDFQACRMLTFSERCLENKRTACRNGRLVYSANWRPRKYSTCGLYPSENACLALAYFRIGDKPRGWEILNGLVDAYFLSRNPGLMRHVVASSGGSELGDLDFTDTSSTYLRLLIEGVWGVAYHLLDDYIEIKPALDDQWDHASLTLRDMSLDYIRRGNQESWRLHTVNPAVKRLKIAMRSTTVEGVYLNGERHEYRIDAGIGVAYIVAETRQTGVLRWQIYHGRQPVPQHLETPRLTSFAGNRLEIAATAAIEALADRAGVLAEPAISGKLLRGRCAKTSGVHTLFVKVVQDQFRAWLPCEIKVNSLDFPVAPAYLDITPQVRQEPLDLSTAFNCELTQIHRQRYLSPRPSGYSIGVRINGRYAWEWNHCGHNALEIDDSRLRHAQGAVTVSSGIVFATPPAGLNVACAALWDNFPTLLTVDLAGKEAAELAILFIGVTNAMQSGVENGAFEVVYADGEIQRLALVHQKNFDDWLVPALQRENESFYFSDFNHAMVQRFTLAPGRKLAALRIAVTANEVIIGLLGVTLLR